MKIKKGMYVRYTRGMVNEYVAPRIAKIVDCSDDELVKIDNGQVILRSDIIDKPSFNIIDLIRFGDIIKTPKGKFEVGYVDNNVIYTLDSKVIACLRTDEHLCFENKIINSIITKEQFNACKYVVERDK